MRKIDLTGVQFATDFSSGSRDINNPANGSGLEAASLLPNLNQDLELKHVVDQGFYKFAFDPAFATKAKHAFEIEP
jgi:hypothetical protein